MTARSARGGRTKARPSGGKLRHRPSRPAHTAHDTQARRASEQRRARVQARTRRCSRTLARTGTAKWCR
eukprot:398511-Alexandrium_andersonii.AAC.1